MSGAATKNKWNQRGVLVKNEELRQAENLARFKPTGRRKEINIHGHTVRMYELRATDTMQTLWLQEEGGK